jgi:hypothetical protein
VDTELYTNKLDEIYNAEFTQDGEPTSDLSKSPLNSKPTVSIGETAPSSVSSPINMVNSSAPVGAQSSPINKEAIKDTQSAVDASTSSITSKGETLQPEINIPAEPEGTSININLETVNTPPTAVNAGEVLNSSNSTINNQSTDVKNISNNVNSAGVKNISNNVNSTAYSSNTTTSSAPSINSETKSDKKTSIFNKLKNTVINKANDLLPVLQNEALEYLGVGKSKITPAINAFNKIDNYLDNRKEAKTDNSRNSTAINNSNTTQGSTDSRQSSTSVSNTSETMNTAVSVDSAKPAVMVAPVEKPASAPATSLLDTTNNETSVTNNKVTYSEAAPLAPAANQTVTQNTTNNQSTENEASSIANLDLSQLVNEMRSIKLILLGGIDINNKL